MLVVDSSRSHVRGALRAYATRTSRRRSCARWIGATRSCCSPATRPSRPMSAEQGGTARPEAPGPRPRATSSASSAASSAGRGQRSRRGEGGGAHRRRPARQQGAAHPVPGRRLAERRSDPSGAPGDGRARRRPGGRRRRGRGSPWAPTPTRSRSPPWPAAAAAVVPYVHPGQKISSAALEVLGARLRRVVLRDPGDRAARRAHPGHPGAPRSHPGRAARPAWSPRMSGGREASGTLKLRGRVAGERFEQSYPLTVLPTANAGNAFVPRLYAAAKIAEASSARAARPRKPTVIELSKRFAVASRFTSLLVLESEAMFKAFSAWRRTLSAPTFTGEQLAESSTAQAEGDVPRDEGHPNSDKLTAKSKSARPDAGGHCGVRRRGVRGRRSKGASGPAPHGGPAAAGEAGAPPSTRTLFDGPAPSPPPPPAARPSAKFKRGWDGGGFCPSPPALHPDAEGLRSPRRLRPDQRLPGAERVPAHRGRERARRDARQPSTRPSPRVGSTSTLGRVSEGADAHGPVGRARRARPRRAPGARRSRGPRRLIAIAPCASSPRARRPAPQRSRRADAARELPLGHRGQRRARLRAPHRARRHGALRAPAGGRRHPLRPRPGSERSRRRDPRRHDGQDPRRGRQAARRRRAGALGTGRARRRPAHGRVDGRRRPRSGAHRRPGNSAPRGWDPPPRGIVSARDVNTAAGARRWTSRACRRATTCSRSRGPRAQDTGDTARAARSRCACLNGEVQKGPLRPQRGPRRGWARSACSSPRTSSRSAAAAAAVGAAGPPRSRSSE